MSNFEAIVRPVVFPNIRPTQPRTVAPESDPEQGFAHINGQGGKVVSLSYNWSINRSTQKQKEIKRRVDVVRVYQKEADGTVNRENFIDVEVTNKMWINESGRGGTEGGIPAGRSTNHQIPINFQRVQEDDNVEFIKEMITKTNPQT
jgi:hypothetical protein